MRKGFTLLELIIVIIILGILATLAFTQYTKVVEKGRTAEAKAILGRIRSAQEEYRLQFGVYTNTMDNLTVGLTEGTCDTDHYFRYSIAIAANRAIATRCTVDGKAPNFTRAPYSIDLTYATGAWGGSAGYY